MTLPWPATTMAHPSPPRVPASCIIAYDFGDAHNPSFTDMLPPAPGPRRNLPVTIEDWPDPDDDFDDSDNEYINRPPTPGEDQDPPYVEPDLEQGLNPEDEPALDENELWDFLQGQLGDLANDEWMDMCECI
jgi:hypothetical protein